MQLIDELEPARRGPYCGALGYFGARGAFDLAIAIRIGVLADRELRVHVGGGIVADSRSRGRARRDRDQGRGLARRARRPRRGATTVTTIVTPPSRTRLRAQGMSRVANVIESPSIGTVIG